MKKIFTVLFCSLFVIPAVAQNKAPQAPKRTFIPDVPTTDNESLTNKTSIAPFWADDFSKPENWKKSHDPKTKFDWLVGMVKASRGSKIKSQTAANGIAVFDSDSLCGKGDQIAYLTTVKAVNIKSHSNIKIGFSQYYARYLDSTFVSVSTNGTAWSKFVVNGKYGNNDFSINPEKVEVDISSATLGKDSVYIRLTYYTTSAMSTPAGIGGCGFSWQIDDVYLMDLPANDLSIEQSFIDIGGGGMYGKLPYSQLDSLKFLTVMANRGSKKQTNVKLNVTATYNNFKEVYNENSAVSDSLPYQSGKVFTIDKNGFFPPTQAGPYELTLRAVGDQIDEDHYNDIVKNSFEVTDSVFARDNGELSKASYDSPGYYGGGGHDQSKLGNIYFINNQAEVNSISVLVDSRSALGSTFRSIVSTVSNDEDDNPVFTEVLTSDIYEISADNQTSKWVTLPIYKTGLEKLLPGAYFVGIEVYDVSTSKNIVIASEYQTQSLIPTTWAYNDSSLWFSVTGNPFIRLNIKADPIGINGVIDHSYTYLAQNSPNPFSNSTTIKYTLERPSGVAIEVSDIMGRVLITLPEGQKNSGSHSVTIDGSSLTRGIYFYSLKTNEGIRIKRMIVE